MSDTAAWQEAGERGDKSVRDAITECGLTIFGETGSNELMLAVGFGGLVAAADFLVAMSKEGGRAILEEWAMGYVRGVMRGAEGPVHESGAAMEGIPRA